MKQFSCSDQLTMSFVQVINFKMLTNVLSLGISLSTPYEDDTEGSSTMQPKKINLRYFKPLS